MCLGKDSELASSLVEMLPPGGVGHNRHFWRCGIQSSLMQMLPGDMPGIISRYDGGKGRLFQRIISLMPPHDVFLAPFVGGGKVLANKIPAQYNIAFDLDDAVIEAWRDCMNSVPASESMGVASASMGVAMSADIAAPIDGASEWFFCVADAVVSVPGLMPGLQGRVLVYADPPYLMSCRSSQRPMYAHEMTLGDHVSLLDMLVDLDCMVMVSGYMSDLYMDVLSGWNVDKFVAYKRSHEKVDEYVWSNFSPATRLHDYSFLGDGFRERERIKRKKARWIDRLRRMPILERQALLSAIDDCEFL